MEREGQDDRSGSLHASKVLAVVVPLILALYALSIGPAVMLRDTGRISQDTFLLIYAPIVLLTYFAPTNQALEWYLSFWSN